MKNIEHLQSLSSIFLCSQNIEVNPVISHSFLLKYEEYAFNFNSMFIICFNSAKF